MSAADISDRALRWPRIAVGVFAAALVLVATRDDPMLSPDSMTYLATAEHLRNLDGFVDFTGEPMTVFGPIYPLLLSPGGRSLGWATLVGAVAAGLAAWTFATILVRRVRWPVAIIGAVAFAASQGLIRVEATVWSEVVYVAFALGMLSLLSSDSPSLRRCATGGMLAGLGFLTRYAGIGLIATGVVMIAAATAPLGWRAVARKVAVFAGVSIALAGLWVMRNLVRTGDPLGPRFEGGTNEAWSVLLRRPLTAVGQLVVGFDRSPGTSQIVGVIVVVGVVVAIAFLIRQGRQGRLNVGDIGMTAFAATSLVVPVMARAATSNDIEYRVMSPMLVPIIYAVAVVANRILRTRVTAAIGVALAAWWCWVGVSAAIHNPDRLAGSAGSIEQFSPALYEVVDGLSDDARLLTNNPQRVWFHTNHEPTLFAFTRPRPGNSHYPLSPAETLREACAGDAYLAWFPGLANAGADDPTEVRPDLSEVVELVPVEVVTGGTLFRVNPVDGADCR